MIPQETIDQILSLDISEVIGKYITLKRKGANYQACCPFHQEKTPSFSVSPSKGIFKCFGCGKAGNGIGFVMEHEKVEFPEAVKRIAETFGIEIREEQNEDPEYEKKRKHREQLYLVNEMATGWFHEQLFRKENALALEYVKSRWSDETIGDFRIGFAPDDWHGLHTWAKEKGIREEILIEAGLLSESKGKIFDYFRNRIIFPVLNRTGRVTGFTGRDFSGNKNTPKYFNTRDTEIFSKGKLLYGLGFAIRTIKEKGYVHLVEGNPDVIRLHQIGKLNTVGTGGTALTMEQVEEIRKFTNSVTLIGDSDKAGQNAVIRSGKIIIKAGMFCNVITLPGGSDKHDPDSFFTSADQLDTYAKEHISDWIVYAANLRKDKAKSPDFKSKLIDDMCDLITRLPASSHELYIEQLSAFIKPKKAWQDRIREIMREEPDPDPQENLIPKHVKLSDWEKYGFYDDNNQYFFRSNKGVVRGTNFVMEPLFHISSVLNAKRLYKITNIFGFSQVIELQQRDLISLAAFKLRIESLGNFLWEAGEIELNKLKRFLYEQTKTCFEITQLGWQKQGFWAWCNGIFNSTFNAVDENGIVPYENDNYYLPASSNIYAGERTLFIAERHFNFRPGTISLNDFSKQLIAVFGENAIFGICFYLASLFRDHIFKLFGFFPILNLFGPKGAGKTELAISLLQFFGDQTKGPNLTNTTKPALADHVALFSNSCCHIDEYRNSVEPEKIEFLKGLWDGTGRTRMNMDKDRKKETTTVDCSIILSGQEMPTMDIALYSRMIFLSFTKVEYNDEEKINFNHLKEIEKTGLTHITHEILKYRDHFITGFLDNYRKASDELMIALEEKQIEDRIFRNWLVMIASYRSLKNLIQVPWEYDQIIQNSAKLIIRQNVETKKSNEISIFWSIVEFLVQDGQIKEEVDFKLDYLDVLKTDLINVQWNEAKTVLMLNHSRLFQLYRVHGNKTKENILPLKTLEYYLQNSKEYLGRKLAVSFRLEDTSGRIMQDEENIGEGTVKSRRKVTTAMCFNYEKLGLSIHQVIQTNVGDMAENLPF